MSHVFKLKNFALLAGLSVPSLMLFGGCGGGGGSSSGGPSGTPSPFDGTYAATVVPSTTPIPSDAQAPSHSLVITNGRANGQFTFFLQPSVVSAVQAAVNKGLTDAGYADEIRNNQVPASITFAPSGQVDGSGKVILSQTLTSRASVSLCGSARLTLDSTLIPNTTGGVAAGQGTYNIQFADKLEGRVRGRQFDVEGTCNNLPLRAGTVSYRK